METTPLSLDDKTAVITGATSGVGLAAAVALARAKATIIGSGRNRERCRAAEEQVRKAVTGAQVRYFVANLALQSEVRNLAQEIESALDGRPLDILVNNAGTYTDKFTLTADGVEGTMAVNHLAPFLLTHILRPVILAAGSGRILTTSSNSHYNTCLSLKRWNHPLFYHGLWAYKVTKLCNVLFTAELNRRLTGTNVRAFAVDPGLVNTEIGLKGTAGLSRWVWKNQMRKGASPEVPSRTILYLASEPSIQDSAELYWRECRPKTPSRVALDEKAAQELWDWSCQMCGIDEK
jgi:NAD(P)-dependent dehydrogenase (short-subunit alcohol dehydrogenase family)